MFRKLQIKFVAIIMASVAIVLTIVFAGICMTEYQRSMTNVNAALTNAIERAIIGMEDLRAGPTYDPFATQPPDMPDDGAFASDTFDNDSFTPDLPDGADAFSPQWEISGDDAGNGDVSGNQDGKRPRVRNDEDAASGFMGPRIGGRDQDERDAVPVAVYMVMDDSTYQAVTASTTAAIDEDVLIAASAAVDSLGDGSGTLGDLGLHYLKRTTETTTYVAFADTSTTEGWQSLAFTLAVAGIGMLLVFFAIALLLSKWALRPVKEAWESQRQFIADASHELKTPLTVILANTSILLKHPQDTIASQSQWVESSQVEAESMQQLVGEMLELAQVESRAAVHHEQLDFTDLVDGEVLQFESVAFERGCELEEDIAEGVNVNGDAQRLRKAVSTLIENALKYVDAQGTVSVTLVKTGANAILSIRNTGSVIAPEDLPHIFDRFYRTDKARTSGTGGYGLGLAIAREIAREHGGDIVCESAENVGTTFTMKLPVLQ